MSVRDDSGMTPLERAKMTDMAIRKGWLTNVSQEERDEVARLLVEDATDRDSRPRDRHSAVKALLTADRIDHDREVAQADAERGGDATGLHVTFEVVDADAQHPDQS